MRVRTAALFVVVLAGCRVGNPTSSGSASIVGRYAGTVPCADCERLEMDLSLHADPTRGTTAGPYDLVETYRGTVDGARTFSSRGWWRLKADESSAEGPAIVELRDLADGYIQNFAWNRGILEQRDELGRPLETDQPHALQPVQ